MGNSESNESAAVKRQAEGGSTPMYEILDLKGGGTLFYITKRAMIKKDYKELDEAIKAKVQPYLYNGGQGKMVPIAQLTMLRNRDRPKSKQLPVIKELGDAAYDFVFEGSELLANVTAGLDPTTSPHLFRECCWMVEKRGSVGETVYHICFLMQTPTHLALGRRLLKWYPKLIKDVYLSEEYYGENVLHMSVVAEDPTTVKYLLDQGVNIHERCYGNFMCPEDQKASRSDSLDHEIVDVCTKSNYQGYVAWGEYSLSFAAKLGQEECYRLILSRGGNHDLQDTNGNTVTHIMVVYDNMKMFDLAVECGASINIKNVQNMTPLTVGAYLARQDMFFHIANIEREVYWQIGNVCCSAYPIEQLDTINSETGNLNMRSALNLIVFGDLTEHLDLIEGVVVDLLLTKWKSFIKARGFKTTGPFVIMIYRMMAADLLRFVTIYFIFVMGFSQAYYIMFQSYTNTTNPDPMPTPMESIISIFIMSLGSFGNVWEGLGSTNHSFLGKIHSFLFLAIVVVLLVNLLIAMMGDTYTGIAEIKNEWMRQWARTVLIVERGIPPKSRLHHQNLYSERMATGGKALVMKQTMSEEKLAEIQDITEMKVTHRRNIKRRLEKFGYTSNSTIGLDLAGTAANVIAPDADGDDNNPLY